LGDGRGSGPAAEHAHRNRRHPAQAAAVTRLTAAHRSDRGVRERREFDRRVARAYESAKAVNAAAGGGIDDVIDPADTRNWIVNSMRRMPPVPARTEKKYPYIDTW